MRRSFLSVLTILCLVLTGSALWAAEGNAKAVQDISIKDLKTAIANKSVTLLDANGTDSFKEGHIPGAIDFDANVDHLVKLLPKDKNAMIVAYCGGPQCMAYKAAAQKALALGYTNVKHLPAGISGWKSAGEKVETGTKSDKAA